MIIFSRITWLTLAGLACSASIYFPFHIVAFFCSAKALAHFSKFKSKSPVTNDGDLLVLAFLACLIMFLYNWGFRFFMNIPYTGSLGQFIIATILAISYFAFGVILITILITTMVLVIRLGTNVSSSLKLGINLLKGRSLFLILGFFPFGALLFTSYHLQQLSYEYLNLPLVNPLSYFVVYLSLFFLSFWGTKNTMEKLQLPQPKVQSISTDSKQQEVIPNIAYAIALAFLMLSPLLTIIIFGRGLVFGINYNYYVLSLYSWFIWLALSIYFILIRKTQSKLTIFIVFIPLFITIISFFSVKG